MGSSTAEEKQLTGIEMKIANESAKNPDKGKQLERVAENMGLIREARKHMSPAKQKVDPLDLGLLDEAKKVTVNKGLPKNFNTTGKDSWVKISKEILSKGKKAQGVLPGKGWGLSTKAPKVPKAPKARTNMKMDINLENKKALNQKIAKVTKSTMPKNFNMTGKDSWVKRSKEILKKSAKKGGKFLGKRATGVLGLLGGGSLNATATNPNVKKSEGEQIKDLLTKHKLKGGRK